MNIATKAGLLSAALGLCLVAGNGSATPIYIEQDSNAVNYCQAFTPGVANTVRNRVVGAENVGSANINVACNLMSLYSEAGSTNPLGLYVYFSNTSTADITISCSLLTSWQGDPDAYLVTKSVMVPAGTTSDDGISLFWDNTDNPTGGDDLGSTLVGINCNLPHGGVINDMYLSQNIDNGVETP